MGLSGRASLPALGASCGSGIPIEELFTQEGLQEQFAKDSTHRSPPNSRSDPNPLAGASLWGHTQDGAPGRSGSKSVVCTQQAASRGHLGTPKAHGGERPPWTQQKAKAGGRESCKGHDGSGKGRWSHKRGVSLHTCHHTHFVLKQLRQPAAKQFQPPTPPTRPSQNTDSWGPGLLPAPVFGLQSGTPCLPKASFKGFTFHADKWIPDSTSATYFKRITQLVLLKNPNDSQTKAQQIQS